MSTLTATQLQQQYIAYFGRPGDPAGIKYWLSSSSGISSAREFADKIYAQDEYKKSTVGSKSTEAQVNSLYLNLFGREADAAGLIYWTGQIEAGTLTLSNIAFDLIAAASNPVSGNETQGAADALALSNKVAAAEAFTADVEASTSAILAYQPESSTPWVTGAAFESGKSYLSGITTTAHSDSGIDSAVTSMISANTTAGSTVAATTSKFTTSQDVLTGGAGDDTFNGVLIKSGDTGTTIAPGDQVNGGAGTDTVNISVSGLHAASYTLEALDTDSVEKVLVSNYETNETRTSTVSGSLFDSSIATVGLSSSSATGDTIFTGLTQKVGAEMRNGAADLTLTYDSSVFSGSSDVQDLTISAVTAGTFGAANAETININTELAKSKLTNISSSGLKTLNISGDQSLEITTALTTKTIDASASTGAVTLSLGSANQTVTGGSGDDVIDGGTVVTSDDTIKGGAGSDILKLSVGNTTYDGEKDDELYNVSEFETIDIAATADTATLELDTLWTGITDLTAAANTRTITATGSTANDGSNTISFTLNGVAYTTATVDMTSTTAATDAGLTAAALQTTIDAIDGFTATVSSAVVTVTNTSGKSDVIEFGTANTTAPYYYEDDIASANNQSYAIGDYYDVAFTDAAGTETVTIRSAQNVTYTQKDASSTSDEVKVNLSVLNADKGFSQSIEDITVTNTETLSLNATGLGSDYYQTLENVSGDSTLTTLNITGSNNLTIVDVASDNTKLVTIDASTYTGDLAFSDAAAAKQTITTGTGNDSIAFVGNLTEDDVIDLGGNTTLSTGVAGKDTVTATGNLGSAVDDSVLQLSNVEVFELAIGTGAATYIDASKFVNTTNLAFSDTGGTVKLKNLPASTTIGAGIGAVEFGSSTTTTLDVALADETGSDDSITIDFADSLDGSSNITFKSTGIETLNIKASKEGTNTETSTFVFGDNAPSKIVVTDGDADDTLALGTLNKTTTEIDAGAYKGILTAASATGIAMTVSANGKVANSVTTSTGADTVTLNGDLGTTDNDISTGTGTDVLNIGSLSSSSSNVNSVDGVETINITVKDSTTAGFAATNADGGLQSASTVNILGGNGLSKFTMTTARFDDNDIAQTIDSSTFAGAVELNFASEALDSNISIKGGSSTLDKVTTIIAATDNKPASITGIESIVVTSTENDTDASFDMTNVSGATSVTATFVDSTDGDQIELDSVPAALTVKAVMTSGTNADADILDIGYTDASSTSTVANVEITSFTATDDALNLDIAGVETLNLYNKGGAATNVFQLADVTATTDSNVKIVVTGTGAVLESLDATVNEIDAAAVTGAISLTQANRPSTAMTITTGVGDDTIAMESGSDVIDSGTGTDTLNITHAAVLGGYAIDLTSTTDQVTQFAGVANSLVQKGFEHVSLAGVTGSFGADITGTSIANTITGTANADSISPGKGNDTINAGKGADLIALNSTSTGGLDTITMLEVDGVALTATTLADASAATGKTITFGNGVDTITGFGGGAGGDTIDHDVYSTALPSRLTAETTVGDVANNDKFYDYGSWNPSTKVFTISSAAFNATTNNDAIIMSITADNVAGITGTTGITILPDLAVALHNDNFS